MTIEALAAREVRPSSRASACCLVREGSNAAVQALTGLQATQVALVAVLGSGLALVVTAVRRDLRGSRIAGIVIAPLALGALVVAIAVLVNHSQMGQLFETLRVSRRAAATSLLTLLAAFGVADYLVVRVVPLMERRLASVPVSRRWQADLAVLVPITAFSAILLMGLVHLAGGPEGDADTSAEIIAEFTLPGHPMDLIFRDANDGYISFGEGQIVYFRLVPIPEERGYDLELTTAAHGLRYPRGLALADGVLYVAELGELPCPEIFPFCKGERVPGFSRAEGEAEILRQSRGRIVAFDVRADGTLGEDVPVLEDLPVVNTDHGINGIDFGPDGLLYVSVGHVEGLWESPEVVEDLNRPNADLVGTVFTYSPEDGVVEIFAQGLRNVYGLAFDPDGALYGVDNDGPTPQGWRKEEVLQIKEGAHYGYPHEGSFGPFDLRTDDALWTLEVAGAAGVAWADDFGLGPGLLVGSCGQLTRVGLEDLGAEGMRVAYRGAVAEVMPVPGCVTFVERGPRSELVLGVFRWPHEPLLYVVDPGESTG